MDPRKVENWGSTNQNAWGVRLDSASEPLRKTGGNFQEAHEGEWIVDIENEIEKIIIKLIRKRIELIGLFFLLGVVFRVVNGGDSCDGHTQLVDLDNYMVSLSCSTQVRCEPWWNLGENCRSE